MCFHMAWSHLQVIFIRTLTPCVMQGKALYRGQERYSVSVRYPYLLYAFFSHKQHVSLFRSTSKMIRITYIQLYVPPSFLFLSTLACHGRPPFCVHGRSQEHVWALGGARGKYFKLGTKLLWQQHTRAPPENIPRSSRAG